MEASITFSKAYLPKGKKDPVYSGYYSSWIKYCFRRIFEKHATYGECPCRSRGTKDPNKNAARYNYKAASNFGFDVHRG
jgi:hypothetical protein